MKEKQYQLFYRENGSNIKLCNLRATDKRMATKFFNILRPECEVVHITSEPTPVSFEQIDRLLTHKN